MRTFVITFVNSWIAVKLNFLVFFSQRVSKNANKLTRTSFYSSPELIYCVCECVFFLTFKIITIRHDEPTQNQLRLICVYFNFNGLWINVIAFTFILTTCAMKSFNIAFQYVRIRLSTHEMIGYPCGTGRINIVIIVLFRCGQTNLRRHNNTVRTFRKRYHNCCPDRYNKYYSDDDEQYHFACEYGNRIWHVWWIFFFFLHTCA